MIGQSSFSLHSYENYNLSSYIKPKIAYYPQELMGNKRELS